MANIPALDAASSTVYLAGAGTGTNLDPYIPVHSVTDGGGSLTVDNAGTFAVQAAQSGTWTVQPGNTANTTAWLVTAAPIGSNGSAVKTSSILVGVSDGTNQQQLVAPIGLGDGVNGNNMVSAGTWVWNGTSWDRLAGTTSGVKAIQSGTWNITNISGTVSLPTGAATAAKQPALGTAGTASSDVITVQGIASMTPVLVTGNVASGAADSGNPVKVGGVYSSSLPTLTNGNRGNLQLDVNGQLLVALGTQLDATNDTVGAQPKAATSGGVTPSHLISAASTNATSLKGSAGQVYGFQLMNKSTSGAAYVKFYNKATSPTVGTDTPVKVITLAAAASSTQPTVVVHSQPLGISFSTGIAFAITGGSGNSDTTAVSAGDVHVEVDYK